MGKKKTIRIVVDTNVIVSGLLFGGIPGKIIEAFKRADVQLLITSDIVNEYIKVLSYPKFELSLSLQKPESFRAKASEGEVVVFYFEPSATQDLKFSGFPGG